MDSLYLHEKEQKVVIPACYGCGRPVQPDEIALTKKLINRGVDKYLCLSCLSEKFDIPEKTLKEKINQFREMGCTLFR